MKDLSSELSHILNHSAILGQDATRGDSLETELHLFVFQMGELQKSEVIAPLVWQKVLESESIGAQVNICSPISQKRTCSPSKGSGPFVSEYFPGKCFPVDYIN